VSGGGTGPACFPNCDRGTQQIALGGEHTCALSYGGTVKCWGANSHAELAVGADGDQPLPKAVPGLSQVRSLALGFRHSCALLLDGTVKCWGANYAGQLGDSSTTQHGWPTPVKGLSGVAQITAGGRHTCARLNDGSLMCWGGNNSGAIGDGTNVNKLVPTLVPGLNVTHVSAGGDEVGTDVTCAVLSDHTVRCWGANGKGQLGDGTTADKWDPTPVPGLTDVVEVAAGADNACARTAAKKVKCWGDDTYGAVGNGPANVDKTVKTPSPLLLPLIAEVLQITVGSATFGWSHGCAVLSSKTISCWGYGLGGELGVSAGPKIAQTPLATYLMIDVWRVAAGGLHTCGLSGSATYGTGMLLKCWGNNLHGELGTDGVPATAYEAVPVPLTWP
jgi:alpha-tubulin suppressor-like RCC1 family protein